MEDPAKKHKQGGARKSPGPLAAMERELGWTRFAFELEEKLALLQDNEMILQAFADHLKEKLKFRYVDRVLKEAVDPLDPQGKVEFMRALMEHMGNQLPPDVRGRPPEDFVEQRDALIRTYVQSRDRVAVSVRVV